MNRMADTVIKEMDNKAHEEEMKIRKWEMQREMAERKKEEERLKRIKNGNEACKKNLFRQIQERQKQRELEEEKNRDQARIWAIDRENYIDEEKRIHERVKKLNHDTAEFLRQQMMEKQGKTPMYLKMNRTEFLYNKNMLRSVNDKLREHSGDRTSRGDAEGVPPRTPAASHA